MHILIIYFCALRKRLNSIFNSVIISLEGISLGGSGGVVVIGLREVVGVVECALVITSANDFLDDSTCNRGSLVVVMTEVILSDTENNWKSEDGLFLVGEGKCAFPPVVVCRSISLGPDVSEVSSVFCF